MTCEHNNYDEYFEQCTDCGLSISLDEAEDMTTISASEIYQEFLKLNDAQKDKIIRSLVAEGVDNESLEALRFLAVLSNEGFRDKVISSLYAQEAFEKVKASVK